MNGFRKTNGFKADRPRERDSNYYQPLQRPSGQIRSAREWYYWIDSTILGHTSLWVFDFFIDFFFKRVQNSEAPHSQIYLL